MSSLAPWRATLGRPVPTDWCSRRPAVEHFATTPRTGRVAARLDRAGPGRLRIHDSRHPAARFSSPRGRTRAGAGAPGHATNAVTMDRYTHLFRAATEALARRMDTMRAAAVAFSRAPGAPPAVIELRPDQRP